MGKDIGQDNGGTVLDLVILVQNNITKKKDKFSYFFKLKQLQSSSKSNVAK